MSEIRQADIVPGLATGSDADRLKMKSMFLLFVGCLPLAVLTVWCFIELGLIDEQLDPPGMNRDLAAETELAAELAAEAEGDKPVAEELAQVELLSGERIPGLESVAAESAFRGLRDAWPNWTAACQMAAGLAEIERFLAAIGAEQFEETRVKELEEARRQLDSLKRQYQQSAARGTGRFLTLLDGKTSGLDEEIDRCKKRLDAAGKLAQARGAFAPNMYGDCVRLCDELISRYSQVLDPSVALKLEVLRRRAQFWHDAELLFAELKEVDSPTQREALLEGFLARYSDRRLRTSAERRVLEQCDLGLRKAKDQLAAERADLAAGEQIRRLKQALPSRFSDRLRSAARIVQTYPASTAKQVLRGDAKQWLERLLPEKQLREAPNLQEAETNQHQIVRGFFAEVKAPDGTLFGYKCYPTPEALADPGPDVGTYRKEDFVVLPGPSVPRRCVRQYEEGRDRLLEDPGSRAAWIELAALCESLDARLAEYRRKKGAGREEPELSFAEEARFARDVLGGAAWSDVQTLFGP